MIRRLFVFLLLPAVLTACTTSPKTEEPAMQEGYKEINGSSVYYKILGKGTPIIVIHGGPVLDHSYMLPQLKELARGHQLIFYDQRACGKSSLEVDTSTMSMAGFVEDIELLRTSLGLEKVGVLGHSWGGLLAMQYALRYPQQLNFLILSNSTPASVAHWQEEEKELAARFSEEDSLKRNEIRNSTLMKEKPSEAIESLMRLSFKAQFFNQQLVDSLTLNIPGDFLDRSKVFQRLGPDLAAYDLYPELDTFNKPTLILYGAHEPAARLSGPFLKEKLPDAHLVILKKCGHFPFIEQPAIYYNTIRRFTRIRRGGNS